MGDKTRGLFHKFNIERTDGTSGPGGKHDGCDYFVLDLTHDKYAPASIRAYAGACREEYPLLAADLDAKFPSAPPLAESVGDVKALARELAESIDFTDDRAQARVVFERILPDALRRHMQQGK